MIRTCPKCGAEVYNDECPICYTKLPPLENSSQQSASQQEYSHNTSQQEYSQYPDSSVYYMNQEANQGTAQTKPKASPSDYKMRWHKWIIYVVLWFNAALYLLAAVGAFELNLPHIGLVCLCIAGYGVYLRFQLSKFKKGAPKKVLIFALLITAYEILYMVEFGTDNQAATVIPPLVWWISTWRYYTKREELFVN